MESNIDDNYVLVLEDRTEVKNEQEAGVESTSKCKIRLFF